MSALSDLLQQLRKSPTSAHGISDTLLDQAESQLLFLDGDSALLEAMLKFRQSPGLQAVLSGKAHPGEPHCSCVTPMLVEMGAQLGVLSLYVAFSGEGTINALEATATASRDPERREFLHNLAGKISRARAALHRLNELILMNSPDEEDGGEDGND